ncbi:hypothetical protein [Parendozoicomonas sp. Alg238-R29]|uniref:hypothetical protein n=1 Tax=Parendozoicomonas sp. Alg238-R29 TaxID=2993446 RepID=UPI00248EC265|nr:hypothetical protein [Parendozoicomonas sp. Alg238-R29]
MKDPKMPEFSYVQELADAIIEGMDPMIQLDQPLADGTAVPVIVNNAGVWLLTFNPNSYEAEFCYGQSDPSEQ